MTEEEHKIMECHGITYQTNTTFHFAGYKYQRLEDAVNYAKTQPGQVAATNSGQEKPDR